VSLKDKATNKETGTRTRQDNEG